MLNAYLTQLNLCAPHEPSLSFLCSLTRRHIATHTFNNLGVLLREPMSLELDAIFHKIVIRQAGGFCFEHNKLLMHCLNQLGYETRLMMARVLNNHVRDVPRTHRITLVRLNGDIYLVDCGFGASVPLGPLQVNTNCIQHVGGKQYQILPVNENEYDVVEIRDNAPFILYRFDSATYSDADCTASHHYSISHPDAVFVRNLVVSLNRENQSLYLVNQTLTKFADDETQRLIIMSAKQLESVLNGEFRLSVDSAICNLLFERYMSPHICCEQSKKGAQ